MNTAIILLMKERPKLLAVVVSTHQANLALTVILTVSFALFTWLVLGTTFANVYIPSLTLLLKLGIICLDKEQVTAFGATRYWN